MNQGYHTCPNCQRRILPVDGVNAIFDRGHWWCAMCVEVVAVNGKFVVNFPSPGCLVPETIIQGENERTRRR